MLLEALLALSLPAAAQVAWEEDWFRVDPRRAARPTVADHRDVLAACAGVRALRDAALACPLDHQTALRGLPDLAAVCARTDGGRAPPGGEVPVPHPLTLSSAAAAAAAVATRLSPECGYELSAQKVGDELRVTAPRASGAAELRVGWRPDARTPPRWLPPWGTAAAEGQVSVQVPIGEIPIQRGWRRFELIVEVVDADGAATRVTLPAEGEAGPDAPLVLGPTLDLAIGTSEFVVPLTDLEVPAAVAGALELAGPQGTLPDPAALAGLPRAADASAAALRRAAGMCGRDARLLPRLCASLRAPDGAARRAGPGEGPALAAAARDDLVSLLRNAGEAVLQDQLAMPAELRSWVAVDLSMALGAVGGMVEAALRGAPPRAAAGAWARRRPPAAPDGQRFGLFAADGVHAAPLSSLLYVGSLIIASGPADEVQLGQPGDAAGVRAAVGPGTPTGATTIALAANLSRAENLPAGVAVPWTGALRPRAGAAEVGWLREMGGRLVVRAARASADNAALHGIAADVRAPSRAAAAGLALTEGLSDALILASTLPSDQLAGTAVADGPRAHALAEAGGELLERLGGGDLAGAASSLGQLFGGPALAPAVGQLPPALMPTVARLSAAAGASPAR